MALKVGLILYSVRDEMAKDPIATVGKVGELGYKFVENFDLIEVNDGGCEFPVPAQQLKDALDQYGSKVVSAHVSPLTQKTLPAIAAYYKTLGNQNIVKAGGCYSTYDDLMRQCEEFNRIGRTLREEGMNFIYHNHNFEWRSIRGKMIMDYLIENTDPDYMSFEMDTFWTMRSGLNPMDMLKHVGRRVKLLHQKDFAWDSLEAINLVGLTPEDRELKEGEVAGMDENSISKEQLDLIKNSNAMWENDVWRAKCSCFTEIGCGIMPIQEIINAANEYTDAEYVILEQDATRMPTQIESIQKSMEGFRKFDGILWE